MNKKRREQPERVLQFYDAEKQRQFAHFSAEDRLDWLAAINELYWQAHRKNLRSPRH